MAKAQIAATQDKSPSNHKGEDDKETPGDVNILAPMDSPCIKTTSLDGCTPIWPEESQIEQGSGEGISEDMEVGDLDLDRMEAACSDQEPTKTPPQQVSLLEKAIIQAKNANTLGVVTESLKVTDGKGKHSKKTNEEDQVISRESKL